MQKAISLGIVTVSFVVFALALSGARPVSLKVVSVFDARCSSCHGKEGSLFEGDFERKYKTDAELREMVASMPGALNMTTPELEVMTAYMRAMSRREPFLVWTRFQNQQLEGEFAPADATVEATAKRTKLKVERPEPRRWRIRLPENVKPEDVELTIRKAGKRIVLKLRDSAYTHKR